MKNPYSPVKGDGLDDDDPLGRVLHLCHRFYSDELGGSLPTIKANYGGAIEVYEGTEKVENIMHLIMVSEFEDGILKDFGMHPRVFRTGYYGPHFLTMSMPLENSDLPAIRMLIPDLLQGIPDDLSKIEPPPLPPHVLCIQHEISIGDHKFAILQTAHGKAYVENLIQFEDDAASNVSATSLARLLKARCCSAAAPYICTDAVADFCYSRLAIGSQGIKALCPASNASIQARYSRVTSMSSIPRVRRSLRSGLMSK